MTQQRVLLLLWCALVLGQLGAASAATGTIAGQLTHSMAQTAMNDVVVWAEPVGGLTMLPPPAQPAEMAQVHLAFTPRVLPVLVGTTVDFPNRDTVYHSVFSFARQQRFEIGLYPPGESRSVTFDTPGLVKVFCNIHDQMFGAILVLPTPYFSTSTPEGSFRLAHVPAGTYTVQVWHERLQGTPHTVTVTAGSTTTLALVLQPRRRAE
jgi:plastocyanin